MCGTVLSTSYIKLIYLYMKFNHKSNANHHVQHSTRVTSLRLQLTEHSLGCTSSAVSSSGGAQRVPPLEIQASTRNMVQFSKVKQCKIHVKSQLEHIQLLLIGHNSFLNGTNLIGALLSHWKTKDSKIENRTRFWKLGFENCQRIPAHGTFFLLHFFDTLLVPNRHST